MKKCGLKDCFWTKEGFGLIELLVIVLIIGILAAVAVPQYKLAVAKSRIAGYMPFVKSIVAAQEVYYLTQGQYTFNLQELDVSVPSSCEVTDVRAEWDGGYNTVYCSDHIMLDNYAANSDTVGIVKLKYCPSYASQGESVCTAHGELRINFFMAHHAESPNVIQCVGLTDFGKKICKTLPEVEVQE